jgi:hypothetical protein
MVKAVTVLHIPPVTSPQAAVKAAIVQEYKDRAKANQAEKDGTPETT